MKKVILLSFLICLSSIQASLKAEEIKNIDWQNLVENENLISKHSNPTTTAYKDIPDNLTTIYDDIDKNHWTYKALEDLTVKYKILAGHPDGNFDGNKPATRYEMAQALAKLVNKVEDDKLELTPVEQAALASLKKEFEKEILTLAARIEINAQEISEVKETHKADLNNLSDEVNDLKKRHYFKPEVRFRLGFGDPESYTETRLRLTSKSYLTDKTLAVLRLEAKTNNMFNHSERDGNPVDADLTLAFIETGDLTSWIPEKAGVVNLIGGLLHTNRLFSRHYRVAVDQRGFSDYLMAVSPYNSQLMSLSYELASGRRMAAGGEYIKQFNKYNALIKAGALRSTGGSLNLPGNDIIASGDESTMYCVMGKLDIPIKNQPVELQASHYYSFGDDQTDKNTWSAGARLATKFENVGVFKTAYIHFGGSTVPRLISGRGGHGFSVQLAYNPTIKAFGNLFGDPDKITHSVYNYIPGKTEIGIAFANLHNSDDADLRVLDIFLSRYITDRIWGVVRYTHANPNSRTVGMSIRDAVEIMTVFKF